MSVTPYQMCINNARHHIRNHPAGTRDCVDAFQISTVIAICFCKDKEEVFHDLVMNLSNKELVFTE